MNDLSKYISWVRYEQRTLPDNWLTNWQKQAECSICRTFAGEVDDNLSGLLYCGECPECPTGCGMVADDDRLERWIVWAGAKFMRDTLHAPQDARIRAMRRLDGAQQYGRRVLA